MNIKQILTKNFSNQKIMMRERYKSSISLVVIIALLFFIDLFLLLAGFTHPVLTASLEYLFIALVSVFCLFLFFCVGHFVGKKLHISVYIVLGIILCIAAIFSIATVNNSINYLLNI